MFRSQGIDQMAPQGIMYALQTANDVVSSVLLSYNRLGLTSGALPVPSSSSSGLFDVSPRA